MKETSLNLKKCKPNVYTNLPENMEVRGELDLIGCKSLTSLPEGLKVGGYLYLNYCTSLESLPEGLKVGGSLVLRICTSLQSLPEGLRVGKGIHIYGSKITIENVPEHLRSKIES